MAQTLSKHHVAGVAWALGITAIIAATATTLGRFELVGRTVAFAYPWRLVEVSDPARITAWIGYALHNLAAWGLLAAVQRKKTTFSGSFRWFNWSMLGLHSAFALLHIAQTQVFYDGLARDVPEVTALGSVALLLMVVLAFEMPRRGLVWGRGRRLPGRAVEVLKRTHGYLFTWALVYTFWYHPTEGTWGHLIGFAYLLMLLWQSVLIYTRAHAHRGWTLGLELLVIPHGVLVAWHQGAGLWPMFAFGFSAIFILTQMHGTGWTERTRVVVAGTWVVGVVVAYAALDRAAQWHEVLRIPVLDYGVVGLIALGFWVGRPRR